MLSPENEERKSAWLLGVCGMGVGPLAVYMRGEGWDVSGWDDSKDSPMLAFLERAGVQITDVPAPGTALVGRSSAVKPGHPLYDLAQRNGMRMVRRGELLAERVATKKLIAVCGSHGKTTTSGMLAQSLAAAGTDAGYVLGGLYRNAALPPARFSSATDWVVAEVDESDGTISGFSPEITIAVNLDWDHPDYYRSESELENTFRELFLRTRRAVFVPEDSERLVRISRELRVPVFRVGASGDYAFRVLSAGTSETRVELGGKFPAGTLTLPVVGRFNVMNAMLALAATVFVSDGKIGTSPLGKFSGMRRRQDVLFRSGNLTVVADYAHHPTEISALLRLLRETHLGRLVAVFQPHRHSRTRQYAAEFARALAVADEALLMPVYSAGEAHLPGGDSADILANVPAGTGNIRLYSETPKLFARLREIVASADAQETLIAFVGAGDIDRIAAAVFVRELWLEEASRPRGNAEDFAARMKKLLLPGAIFRENENLAKCTTLGLGGNARYYAEPADVNELEALLRGAAVCGVPVFALGRGSNLLVVDAGFDGLVIRLSQPAWRGICRVRRGGNGSETESAENGRDRLRVGAGTKLKELCAFAMREGLSGFEFLEGIPGTLGGALRMNAGAMGASIFDVVESVEWITPAGARHEVSREKMTPGYRDCPELHGAIVLGAVLRARECRSPEEIRTAMEAFSEMRKGSQPRERSAGCTFRNPESVPAGKLIDELGLKGSSVGGAEVSDVHANFIIARGNATATDFLALVRRIHGIVKAERGIELTPEIELLGASWSDVLR